MPSPGLVTAGPWLDSSALRATAQVHSSSSSASLTHLDPSCRVAQPLVVSSAVKFSSKMDDELLRTLREHAAREGRTLSSLLTEAASSYLARVRVRPAFREATAEVLDEHAELLEQLAR